MTAARKEVLFMAVFRVERTRDYTVMSNHHLKNRALSLKAKGLLSLMLSLPDDWDYTTKGLSHICKDGVDSICACVRELEQNGYLKRRRIRNSKGQLAEIEYTILEQPEQPPEETPLPKRENPVLDKPSLDNPELGKPKLENPAQLNTKRTNIPKKSNIYGSNTQSFFPSGPGLDGTTDVLEKREEIREQIEYDAICSPANREQIDEFVEIMLEVAMARSPTIKIGRDAEYPTAFVQDRFEQLDASHIEKVLDGIRENTTRVRNTKAYLLASLFNAPSSTDNHYTMLVNHDLYGGDGSR